MLLTRKSSGGPLAALPSSLVASLARGVSRAIPTMDRRAFLRRSGPRRRRRPGGVAVDADAQGAGRRRACGSLGAQGAGSAHRLRSLLGGMRGRRGGRERRLGAPGAGVRLPDQPGCALRQGRRAARTRAGRVPPEVPDEAGRRQVPAHRLGPGTQRDQREDARAEEAERPGLDLRRRIEQAQQRAGLPAAQVGVVLGQQQHRPPGAHLPLHHGRRCRQYLGVWRDDQLLQRHAEHQGGDVHRLATQPKRIRCRCCTCCTPRKPAAR